MKKPEFHILLCNSYRLAGDAKGVCNKKNAPAIIQYMISEASDRGMDVTVSTTGCLNVCAQGPVMVIHPCNYWYGAVDENAVDEILDALEEGKSVAKYLISD
ncbi:Ferredoxin, 2Fe-2S [Arcticibacter svalbardensis MN12-7]|uniref:Ferredoxin, 2Fe-2S n=1 Tax=Arcticibacter svalbardensis MN12-7 TaxID=1150600 RepID=R9GZ80_9SPHI|nr:(2Fe-2S) ferredoxin domain-containing protein [Arcticibacter svalbardensis]EOR94274.1 Ferredoxin, 2Fe-2S [Arcticibacter svalbardensis MN12-7]